MIETRLPYFKKKGYSMVRSLLAKSAAVLLLLSTALLGAPYQVDASHSDVSFKIRHLMISNVKGNFNEFSGTFDLEKGQLSSLNGTIKTASIDTGNAKRDDHLRNADFFDAKKYPSITFKLLEHKGDIVIGELTIKGVTKKVELEIEMGGEVDDPWGKHRAGFSLSGKINRKDFGLTWNKVLEAGGVAVGDKVKLSLELEGVRQ